MCKREWETKGTKVNENIYVYWRKLFVQQKTEIKKNAHFSHATSSQTKYSCANNAAENVQYFCNICTCYVIC